MHKTTNILLIIVIVLLVALLIDRNAKPVYAVGGGYSNAIIFEANPLDKDSFYLIDTENKIILNYQDVANRGIGLKSWRKYDFDSKVGAGQFVSKKNEGETYDAVKAFATKQ